MAFAEEPMESPMRSIPGRGGPQRRVYIMASAQLLFPGEPPIEAYTINVSSGGLCLYTRQFLPVDSTVTTRIFYPDKNPTEFSETIEGRVKWYRPVGQMYGLGIEFMSLDPERHSALLAILQRPDPEEAV